MTKNVRNNMQALRFLHIPKTAGTTFNSILKRQYFGKKSFNFTSDIASDKKRFEALSEKDRASIALFTGHAPIKTGIKEADNAIIITFLREPISRVKSLCQHVSEGKSPYLLDKFPPSTFNLDDFLESGIPELENFQTRALVNSRQDDPSSFAGLIHSETKDMALNVLFNKVSYFGLQEYFNESLLIFSSALNWRMPVYASKNTKKVSKSIVFEQRHLEKITALNKLDLEIYSCAREYYLDSLAKAALDEEKLKLLLRVNKLAKPVIKIGDRMVGLASWLSRSAL